MARPPRSRRTRPPPRPPPPRAAASLELQVRLEPVAPALSAEARLLVAAEGRRRVEPVVRVRPNHAGPEPLRHPQDPRALLGPNPGRQAVGCVVRLLDRLVRR